MHSKRIVGSIMMAVIFLAVLTGRAAEPGIVFTGYAHEEKGLLVALQGSASGNTKWVAIGQEFEGCTVRQLDEKTDTLTVMKGGVEFRLPLNRSKIKKVAMEPAPEIKQRVVNNLRQLKAAADQYFLETGKKQAAYQDLVGPDKYVKQVEPVDGEIYTELNFEVGQRVLEVTTGTGHVISYRR